MCAAAPKPNRPRRCASAVMPKERQPMRPAQSSGANDASEGPSGSAKAYRAIGNDRARVAAVARVSREQRVIAQILAPVEALLTAVAGIPQPRDAHPGTARHGRDALAHGVHATDDLMTWNDRQRPHRAARRPARAGPCGTRRKHPRARGSLQAQGADPAAPSRPMARPAGSRPSRAPAISCVTNSPAGIATCRHRVAVEPGPFDTA